MNFITKSQPIFLILAALLGLFLGYCTSFGAFAVSLIEPFLMVLLFFVFLSVDGKKLRDSFRNVRFTLAATAVNFLWTPIFAYGLGKLFFADSIDLQMGLMMLMVTPCTDWYLIFTALAGGNVELGASLLPWNLLLQIVLMPVYLLLFFGGSVHFGIVNVLTSIVLVLLIPFLASFLLKRLAAKCAPTASVVEKLKESGDQAQLVFLCLAVVSMFASESRDVFENPALLFRMFLPMAVFFAGNYLLVRILGCQLRFPFDDLTALNFTTMARNSPLSLAIAVAAFPDRPLISLALVIGPLIELPALAIAAHGVKKERKNRIM